VSHLADLTPTCGYPGPSVNCGCEYHREWVRQNPEHPDVVAGRAEVVAWMAENLGYNPATGRAMAHPDDFLMEVYGSGATSAELNVMGLVL
jgi:hypothetical protein